MTTLNKTDIPCPEKVLELLNARDEGALEMLDALYGKLMKKIAVGILRSDEDAEETKNDTLFEVWKRIPPDQPENLRAYVASVCRSKALDRIRYAEAKKRDRNATQTLGELDEPTEGFENEAVDSMAVREIVNAFLGELSARDRQIFMKRYYLFQPIPSIASSLGVSNELVKSSLFRMRNKLKKELERGLK